MLKDTLKLRGDVSISLRGPDGQIKETHEYKNLVVTTGLNYIASRMKDTTKAAMSHMAVGSSNTAAQASNTDIGSILGSREAIDSTTVSGATVTYISSFEAGDGTGNVVEASIHNSLSGGDMLCRTVFPVISKQADDTMQISWVLSLTAS
jgi:hypothetical protein|tara:strand:- start:568 stop:1017 length:450 start_codon:yes stop_codon:yes gene_type:complete